MQMQGMIQKIKKALPHATTQRTRRQSHLLHSDIRSFRASPPPFPKTIENELSMLFVKSGAEKSCTP
jgi:hypothetical protein